MYLTNQPRRFRSPFPTDTYLSPIALADYLKKPIWSPGVVQYLSQHQVNICLESRKLVLYLDFSETVNPKVLRQVLSRLSHHSLTVTLLVYVPRHCDVELIPVNLFLLPRLAANLSPTIQV